MSEHHQGKLICVDAGDETEFDLDTSDGWTIASCFRGNARRLAAAWNACEGMTTENLESIVFVGETIRIRFDFINAELRQAQAELNAARALLGKVGDWLPRGSVADQVRSYLDACDTLEGK